MTTDKSTTKEVHDVCHREFVGPPGGQFLKECILNDAPNATEQDIRWIIDCIYTQIIHRAIWSCNHDPKDFGFPQDQFEQDNVRVVRVLLESIK